MKSRPVVLSNCACSSLFFASLFLELIAASLLPASPFLGSFVVTRCGSFSSCADFLLPFYYLLISSSRLFTVLTASMSPIPKQKLTIPIPIKDPITSDLLEVNKFLFISTCSAVAGLHCLQLFILHFYYVQINNVYQ